MVFAPLFASDRPPGCTVDAREGKRLQMSGDSLITPATALAPSSHASLPTADTATVVVPAPSSSVSTASTVGASTDSPPFGFQLQIDPATQQVIIEARDPVTGFVVFQAPSKTAFSAVAGSAAQADPRGQRVNREI